MFQGYLRHRHSPRDRSTVGCWENRTRATARLLSTVLRLHIDIFSMKLALLQSSIQQLDVFFPFLFFSLLLITIFFFFFFTSSLCFDIVSVLLDLVFAAAM